MKVLEDGVFYYINTTDKGMEVPDLWHTCAGYKGRAETRIQLELGDVSESTASYSCPHCDFTYSLNRRLALQKSRQ